MNDSDQQRQLAANARIVQNLQLKLIAGTIVGGLLGILIAAYIVLPAFPSSFVGAVVALACIPIGAILGQRMVLNLVAR